MPVLTVAGIFFVIVFALTIIFRRQYVRLVHAFLKFFIGEAVADDSVRPNSEWQAVIFGVLGIGFGVFAIINSLYFQ